MRNLVYVCSPLRAYENRTQRQNIAAAVRYSRYVYEKGFTPIAPHIYFTQFMNDNVEKERTDAVVMGKQLLRECSELWVFGSYISEGMRSEIALAKQWGIPITYVTVIPVGGVLNRGRFNI